MYCPKRLFFLFLPFSCSRCEWTVSKEQYKDNGTAGTAHDGGHPACPTSQDRGNTKVGGHDVVICIHCQSEEIHARHLGWSSDKFSSWRFYLSQIHIAQIGDSSQNLDLDFWRTLTLVAASRNVLRLETATIWYMPPGDQWSSLFLSAVWDLR